MWPYALVAVAVVSWMNICWAHWDISCFWEAGDIKKGQKTYIFLDIVLEKRTHDPQWRSQHPSLEHSSGGHRTLACTPVEVTAPQAPQLGATQRRSQNPSLEHWKACLLFWSCRDCTSSLSYSASWLQLWPPSHICPVTSECYLSGPSQLIDIRRTSHPEAWGVLPSPQA